MTKRNEEVPADFQEKMMRYFADSYAREFIKQHPFPSDAQEAEPDEDESESDNESDSGDSFALLKEMLAKLSSDLGSLGKLKDFDAEQARVDAELSKVPEFREYREFLDWAFGQKNGGQPVDFVDAFAKLHPSLPAMKVIEHEYANRDANLGVILFQAAKHYFENVYGLEFK